MGHEAPSSGKKMDWVPGSVKINRRSTRCWIRKTLLWLTSTDVQQLCSWYICQQKQQLQSPVRNILHSGSEKHCPFRQWETIPIKAVWNNPHSGSEKHSPFRQWETFSIQAVRNIPQSGSEKHSPFRPNKTVYERATWVFTSIRTVSAICGNQVYCINWRITWAATTWS